MTRPTNASQYTGLVIGRTHTCRSRATGKQGPVKFTAILESKLEEYQRLVGKRIRSGEPEKEVSSDTNGGSEHTSRRVPPRGTSCLPSYRIAVP